MLDDLGSEVLLRHPPKRVVSLVPSLTEALAVTLPGALVAATDWCTEGSLAGSAVEGQEDECGGGDVAGSMGVSSVRVCSGTIGWVLSGECGMGRPPVVPVERKTRIVLSVLAGEVRIAEATRRERVSEQLIGRVEG